MKNTVFIFALMSILMCGLEAFAIGLNEPVPAFEATDDEGKVWKSTDHIGKKMVVLYFYPADMTGGCTAQACGYRDRIESFERLNAEVIGVSGDTAKNHQVFKKAHQLNFTLLADTDGKIAELFGVPVSKGKKTVTKSIDGVDVDLTGAVNGELVAKPLHDVVLPPFHQANFSEGIERGILGQVWA